MTTSQPNTARKAGVLPVGTVQLQAQTAADSSKSTKSRSAAATQDGVKAKVRRLPPGLTEDEFWNALGDTWRVGKGKVAWFRYHQGHIPKSTSKDSTPAFAFLQIKEEDLEELSLAVQNAVWEDAKGSFNSPSLIGPPVVERSIYKKIPTGKPKKDPKEGTIDQDEEYKAFLASLAEDTLMKANEDELIAEDTSVTELEAKPALTPLVAALREKRAKAKEAASAKGSKHARQESQGGKGKTTDEPKKKSKDKADKPKETVKILKKQAATEAAAEVAKALAKEIKTVSASSESTNSRPPRIKGVADILKRDLGLSKAAKSENSKKSDAEAKTKDTKSQDSGATATVGSSSTQASDRPSAPTAPKAQTEKSSRGSRRRGKDSKATESKNGGSSETQASAPVKPLVILQKKKEDVTASSSPKDATPVSKSASKSAAPATVPAAPNGTKAANTKGNQAGGSQKKGNSPAGPSSGAIRAFLKHANPSQGVTEALLKEKMEAFGTVASVEIDRRKGFAYIDFTNHDGLVKAMAASPVTIANATVQVLERKDQAPKKAPAASNNNNNVPQTSNAKGSITTAGPSHATPTPTGSAVKEANSTAGEPQQPKRSRRRGRGNRGNGGAGASSESKAADQSASGGSATPASATKASGAG